MIYRNPEGRQTVNTVRISQLEIFELSLGPSLNKPVITIWTFFFVASPKSAGSHSRTIVLQSVETFQFVEQAVRIPGPADMGL